MGKLDFVRLAEALARKAAHERAETRRRECAERGHQFMARRVWCLHCKSIRNPDYPRKEQPATRRGPKLKPRPG